MSCTEYERRIREKVIFSTANHSFGDLLVFSNNPVSVGIKCIRDGRLIITDVEMVKSGIDKRYQANVRCFVNDDRARQIAAQMNITRTAAGIRLAKDIIDGNLVAIGNSPAACMELCKLIEEGITPAMVVATPVGFINATRAKERILATHVPVIAIRGDRGGSSLAVAIVNEIIKIALESK